MTQAIPKAANIPEQARYDAQRRQWEWCELVDGVRHGPFQQWRPDGSRSAVGAYDKGKLQGKLQRFHPNGEVAWEGSYVAGQLEGEVVATGSVEPSPEHLRECCVPNGAWQMRTLYEQGRSRGDRFYDREGKRLLSDGSPYPDRPAHLPSEAWFEESGRRWVFGARDEQRRHHGEWRWWFADGTLCEAGSFSAGKRTGQWRTFSAQGQKLEVAEFCGGVRHGPFTTYATQADELSDARIKQVSGHLDQGIPIGAWEFRDADSQLLKRVDLGPLPSEARLRECPVFLDVEVPPAPATWASLAAALVKERQLGAALCALARGAAQSGDAEMLRSALLEHTCALSPQRSAQLIKSHRGSWVELVHALARGADPIDTLRALASGVSFSKRAARDFISAGLLLGGSRLDLLLSRALNRLEFGDHAGALADAIAIAEQDAAAGHFVRDLTSVLFGSFQFTPREAELPVESFEDLPSGPAQPLAAVNAAIAKCALRLGQLRAALQRLYAMSDLEAIALPPDVSHLVQGANVELGHWQFEIEEDGKPVKIEVDERLKVDSGSAVALLNRARVEWTALCWLCWGAGMNAVAQPQSLNPPPNFNQALGQAVQRYWRCKDQATTSGLLARRQGVPAFRWHDLDLTLLPSPLLQLCSNEYMEQRAILFWLADDQCQSPWQDDLRPT